MDKARDEDMNAGENWRIHLDLKHWRSLYPHSFSIQFSQGFFTTTFSFDTHTHTHSQKNSEK